MATENKLNNRKKAASPQTTPDTSFASSPFARVLGTPSSPFKASLTAFPPVPEEEDYAGFDDTWRGNAGTSSMFAPSGYQRRSRSSSQFGGVEDLATFFESGTLSDEVDLIATRHAYPSRQMQASAAGPPLTAMPSFTPPSSQTSRLGGLHNRSRSTSTPLNSLSAQGGGVNTRFPAYQVAGKLTENRVTPTPSASASSPSMNTAQDSPDMRLVHNIFTHSPGARSTDIDFKSPDFSDSMLKTKRPPLLTPASPPFDFAAAIDAKKQKLAESKKRLEELKALSRTQTIDLQGKPVNASFSERTMLFKMSEKERKLQEKLAEEQERAAIKLAQAQARAAKAERDRAVNAELYRLKVDHQAKIDANNKAVLDKKAKEEADEQAKEEQKKVEEAAQAERVKKAMNAASPMALSQDETAAIAQYLLHIQSGGQHIPAYEQLLAKYYRSGGTEASIMQYLEDADRQRGKPEDQDSSVLQQAEQAAQAEGEAEALAYAQAEAEAEAEADAEAEAEAEAEAQARTEAQAKANSHSSLSPDVNAAPRPPALRHALLARCIPQALPLEPTPVQAPFKAEDHARTSLAASASASASDRATTNVDEEFSKSEVAPASAQTDSEGDSNIPIRDRFKHRRQELQEEASLPEEVQQQRQQQDNTSQAARNQLDEYEEGNRTGLPLYPGSVTSLATLVEEPLQIAKTGHTSTESSRQDEKGDLSAWRSDVKKDDAEEGDSETYEYDALRPDSSLSSVRTLVGPSTSYEKILPSDKEGDTSSPSPTIFTRPGLTSSKSEGRLSTLTADIPAFNVFAADSKPLELPLLDEYISSLPGVRFSEPEKVLSDEEMKGWNEWIYGASNAGGKKDNNNNNKTQGLWNRFVGKLYIKRRGRKTGYTTTDTDDVEYDDDDDNKKVPEVLRFNSKQNTEQAKRALIFPPMHRLPPNITVTDLKYNRSKKAPLISLNVILATAIDAVLGAEGSTYAVSLIRVEAFRDLIQILGSVTNFAKPVTTQSTAAAAASLAAISSSLSNSTTTTTSTLVEHLKPLANATIPFDRTSPRYVILTVVPSILGLDFVSAFGKAILWLWVFTIICYVACWELRVMAREVGSVGSRKASKADHGQAGHFTEGLDCEDSFIPSLATLDGSLKKGKTRRQPRLPGMKWYSRIRRSRSYRITVIFLVTSLYLPLSKISIGALAWTSDYWAVENYYLLSDDPNPSPLGPTGQYRNPLDFCYTTTMKSNGWNWAPPILIIASFTVIIVTLWFPIRLLFVVQSQVPKIDGYTELGEKRRDVKAEYNRLLERDQSPFSFIYNEYRKPWAGFKSAYMALKLINVLCITLLTKDNCIFRHRHRVALDVIRQSTILGFMICWMVLQIWAKPFNDRYQNNSDWCFRIAYVVIAILGLAAALRLPGKAAYGGWLLVTFTAVSYVFNGYFAVIGTVFAQRLVKKWQKRLDFSIDVFAPNLDTAKHIVRRIQQETISTLLLAEPEYKLKRKPDEPLVFCNLSEAANAHNDADGFPPYLIGFNGSQGERHLENLKILREIGLPRYMAAVESSRDPTCRFRQLQTIILDNWTGPDCVWWTEHVGHPHAPQTSFFGRATVLPFPFTLVMRYDETGQVVTLTSESEFETYVAQNESPEAQSGRKIRLALRALEGCRCYFPHETEGSPAKALAFVQSSKRELGSEVQYNYGMLKIERNLEYRWRGYNYNSGFKVQLEYHDGRYLKPDGKYKNGVFLALDGEDLGIAGNFALTNTLARFLQLNRHIVEQNMPKIEDKLAEHRTYFRDEMEKKRRTLSYGFLTDVYGDEHFDRHSLERALAHEEDPRTRALSEIHTGAITFLEERMQAANRDILSQWWYLLWDDIYRRNCNSIPQLQKYEPDFSPKYRSSICYKPMPRQQMESFLNTRGLWLKGGTKGFFTQGILNRVYFYMDEMLFAGTKAGIAVKVGKHRHPVDFHDLGTFRAHDREDSFGQDTKHTYDTGQGTDHDESFVRNRPAFLFEEMYERSHAAYRLGFAARLARLCDTVSQEVQIWFGIRPYESATTPPSLYFSLREEKGSYRVPRGSRIRGSLA